jgi:hypothetical protein
MKYATWFLEHGNKWWKCFLQEHTANGGGPASNDPASQEKQALQRYGVLTHPEISHNVMEAKKRRMSIYICAACEQPKTPGHTEHCPAAQALKESKKYLQQLSQTQGPNS